jgi:hypothetical protein
MSQVLVICSMQHLFVSVEEPTSITGSLWLLGRDARLLLKFESHIFIRRSGPDVRSCWEAYQNTRLLR